MKGALSDPVDIIVNSMSFPQMFLKRPQVSSSYYELLSAEKTQNTVRRNLSELLQFIKKHFDVEYSTLLLLGNFTGQKCRASI